MFQKNKKIFINLQKFFFKFAKMIYNGSGFDNRNKTIVPIVFKADSIPVLRQGVYICFTIKIYNWELNMKLAIIGAGKMATALTLGLIQEKELSLKEIIASDISEEARKNFENKTGVKCVSSSLPAIRDADIVMLSIKPQSAKEIVNEISDACQGKLILSIMAGIPLKTLYKWFNSKRIVRIMPNTPMMAGKGATVFTCGSGLTEEDRLLTRSFFKIMGIVFELPESQMNAVTALSGSGPAYIFEFVQALVEAGVKLGLNKDTALDLTVQTVAGAAEMLRQKMGTPDELRIAVTSKGGTTEAGLSVLEKAKFRKLIEEVVRAAEKRSRELGAILD